MLNKQVKTEIREFLELSIADFIKDAIEYSGMDITFATNDEGDQWNFQTGDNSFTGGCYGLPHWAVTCIEHDSTISQIMDEIIEQFEMIEVSA